MSYDQENPKAVTLCGRSHVASSRLAAAKYDSLGETLAKGLTTAALTSNSRPVLPPAVLAPRHRRYQIARIGVERRRGGPLGCSRAATSRWLGRRAISPRSTKGGENGALR